MMANPFAQFDKPDATSVKSDNPFSKFDAKSENQRQVGDFPVDVRELEQLGKKPKEQAPDETWGGGVARAIKEPFKTPLGMSDETYEKVVPLRGLDPIAKPVVKGAAVGADALSRAFESGTGALAAGVAGAVPPAVHEAAGFDPKVGREKLERDINLAEQLGMLLTGEAPAGVSKGAAETLKGVDKTVSAAATGAENIAKKIGGAPGEAAAWGLGQESTAERTSRIAMAKIADRMAQDEKAWGVTAQSAFDRVSQANAEGRPLALADVTGRNVRSLAGNVARQPGESSAIATKALVARDQAATDRLSKVIDNSINSGPSMRKTYDELKTLRSETAQPLFEHALSPGSTAPLEQQFTGYFNEALTTAADTQKAVDAATQKLERAQAQKANAGANLYLSKDAVQAESEAAAELFAAKEKSAAVQKQLDQVRDVLQTAQKDREAGIRGGLWSPRLQQFLDQPEVQEGIREGLKLQRREAVARQVPFNPRDYAITGADAEGHPIVSKVPNMRLLQAAKEGLDALLDSFRDKWGNIVWTKDAHSIDEMRRAFVDELDKLNPNYKVARQAWAGPSQSMDAMKLGQKIFNDHPEDIAKRFSKLSAGEKEFYKIGVADTMRQRLLSAGFSSDEAKKIIGNPWMKQQLRPIFSSEQEFNKFVEAVTDESTMFETKRAVMGGSQTAERATEDLSNVGPAMAGARGLGKIATGNIWGGIREFYQLHKDLGLRPNADVNAEISRLLFDPKAAAELAAKLKERK